MSNRAFLIRCLRLLRPHVWILVFALAATLAGAVAFGALDPLFQKLLIDSLTRGEMRAFVAAALLMVLSGTVSRVMGFLATTQAQKLKNHIAKDLAVEMFGTFYRIPYTEVASHERGYFVSRVFDEPAQLAGELVDVLLTLLRWLVVLVGAISVALWLSWEVALGVSLIVPFLLKRAQRSSSRISELAQRESEQEAVLKEGLGRAVDGYKTVRLFGLQRVVMDRADRLLDGYLLATRERIRHGAGFQAGSGMLLTYAELIVTLGAALQVVRGDLTVGGLFGFMGAYFRVINAVNVITGQVPVVGKLKGALVRLEEFRRLAASSERRPDHECVELADLEFAFSDAPVLQGVNLRVERGERLLVTGPNGSGKSTLAHIIAGFLDGTQGGQLRPDPDRVSALLLPFGFIPGNGRDNLDFDRLPEAKQQSCLALARRFNLHDRLDQDPATLSQGEQRKFQVLMTLLKDAEFYVFDEPLSNVDTDSKGAVMDAILTLTRDRALVVIMHGEDQFRGLFDREIDVRRFGPVPGILRGSPAESASATPGERSWLPPAGQPETALTG